MKPGDLRQFKDELRTSAHASKVAGRPFMVLEAATTETACWVNFLIDGRIERGWGGDWVEQNSEVIHESR